MQLLCTDNLPSDKSFTHKEIIACLQNIKQMMENSGFRVIETHFDSEAKNGDLSKYPNIIIHPPDQHVARAERGIRTMKEQLRAFVQEKPWLPWFGRFAVEAVATATMYISLRHSRNSESRNSPFGQLTGRVPVIDRDFKACFGDLVAVENTVDTNKKLLVDRERVRLAVWLRPAFDDHGSAFVLDLVAGLVVKRTQARLVGWEDQQQALNRLWLWSGTPRVDAEMQKVRFTSRGKEYDLRVLPPDPQAEVVWEQDSILETETVIGRSSGGFPIPTRHQSGVDLPALPPVREDGAEANEIPDEQGAAYPGQDLSIARDPRAPVEGAVTSPVHGEEDGSVEDGKSDSGDANSLQDTSEPTLSEAVAMLPASAQDPESGGDTPDNLVTKYFPEGKNFEEKLEVDVHRDWGAYRGSDHSHCQGHETSH